MGATANLQILRSYTTDTPPELLDGQLAYSFTSDTLFIGNQANNVFAIGGNTVFHNALAANTFLPTGGTVNGSVIITKDTTVGGNLRVLGAFTTINTVSILVNDPLIEVGANNHTDVADIGFIGHYNNGQHVITGLFREPNTKEYYLFQDYSGPYGNNNISITDPTFTTANLHLSYLKGNVISGGTVYINGLNVQNAILTTQGVDATQNAWISANVSNIQGIDNSQNTRMSVIESNAAANISNQAAIDAGQNTTITAVNSKMQSTYVNQYAAGAYALANTDATNITLLNQYASSGYATANSAQANTIFTQGVDATQNNWIGSNNALQAGINATQNTQIGGIQGVDLAQNASITIIQGVDSTQNVQIGGIQGADNTQNTQIGGIQGVDLAQNASITIIQGVDSTQNVQIGGIKGVDLSNGTGYLWTAR